MDIIFWIIVIAALFWVPVLVLRHPKVQAKLPVKKAAPATPAKVGVAPIKTLAQVNAEDHAYWMADYKAILQKDCDHLYHHQNWYTCMLCGYEEPWEHLEGCRCRYEELRTLTDVHPVFTLIERQSWCIVHGIDFKLFPISNRKRGPYGPQSDSRDSVELSRELTRGRSMRRIDYDIEGTN
jgi:hypothetical protein